MSEVENICRACLGKSRSLLIFQEKVTKFENVYQCFQNLTSIMINSEEVESKICRTCIQKLKQACEFKEQCLENDEKYRDLLESAKQDDSGENETTDYQEQVWESVLDIKAEVVEEQENNFENNILDEEIKVEPGETNDYEHELSQRAQSRTKLEGKKIAFTCSVCGQLFKSKNARICLVQHERKVHNKRYKRGLKIDYSKVLLVNENDEICTKKPRQTSFNCSVCGKLFESKNARICLVQHERKVHNKRPKRGKKNKIQDSEEESVENKDDDTSNKVYDSEEGLKNEEVFNKVYNMRPKREKKNKIQDTEEKSVENKDEVHNRKEELELEKDETFNCAFCPETTKFDSWKECDMHERNVHGKCKKFICDLCGDYKKQKWRIKVHIHRHIGIKKYKCTVCGSGFDSQKSMLKHKKNDHNVKEFNCTQCDSSFHSKPLLDHHMSLHLNSNPANCQCNICGLTFRGGLQTLEDHLRVHRNEYSFQCDQCGKRFQRQLSYKLHLRKHERDRRGILTHCPVEGCKVTFKQKKHLKMHMKRHAGLKDHSCMFCEKKFFTRNHLVRHVLSMHVMSNFNCKICGFQMRLRKDFQKAYIDHAKEKHSNELSSEEMELFEYEIRKLKFADLCEDLPASLKIKRDPRAKAQCSVPDCKLLFASQKQLQEHNEKVHSIQGKTIELTIEKLE